MKSEKVKSKNPERCCIRDFLAVMVLKDACLLGQESIPIRNTFVFFLQSFKSLFFSVVASSIIILPLSPILAPHRFSPKESQESLSAVTLNVKVSILLYLFT